MENKVCIICGKEFTPKRYDRVICSAECRKKFSPRKYSIKNKKSICEICGKEFVTKSKKRIFCGDECSAKSRKRPHKAYKNNCVWCGKEFISNRVCKFCSKSYNTKSRDANTLHHRPYKINNSKQNRIYRNKIGERDNWICNICGKKVNKELKYPDIMSASLDHIIPLSMGGKHIESNVHISHLYCNIKKQDKIAPYGVNLFA